jgi:hypothetical protein
MVWRMRLKLKKLYMIMQPQRKKLGYKCTVCARNWKIREISV